MAKIVLKDVVVVVDGTTLSNRARSVEINTEFDEHDVSGFGTGKYKEMAKGLASAEATVTFYQDFDAANVDAILWPLSQSDTPFPVEFRPSSGAVSATNPKYSLPAALLFSYSPLAGEIGQPSTTDVTFRNAGTQGLTRATA